MQCLYNFALRNLTRGRIFRRHISVLYITGDKAKENYAPLAPFMDFQKRLGDYSVLNENITRRELNIDLKNLKEKYEAYCLLLKKKTELEQTREEISQEIKRLKKETDNLVIDELKSKAIGVRNELKSLKENIYPVEDELFHQFLNLPNELHKNCPKGSEETLIYRKGLPPQKTSTNLSHLNRKNFIEFFDKDCYYLFDDAAQFELDCTHLCRDFFVKNDFVPMTNPDFTRKVLTEANLTPPNQFHGVYEEDQRHHLNSAFLTGGGSFESFLGHLAKLSVYPSVLPLRLISTGRQYKSKEELPSEMGLYAATQSNVVQTLVATKTLEEADRQLDEILNLAVDFYKSLGVHFRIVFIKPSSLTRSESLRASIELYSPSFSRYFEVGSVSHYLDFVSERILFHTKEKKDTTFLHLVGGPIVNTSVLIASMIENQVDLAVNQNHNRITQAEVFKSLFD